MKSIRVIWKTVAAVIVATLFMSSVAVSHAAASGRHDGGRRSAFPAHIDLPDGFRPEGIAIRGNNFFVGSLADGAIYRGDLRTGEGTVIGGGAAGSVSVGLAVDRNNRVFAAGGPTGTGRVIDGDTGQVLKSYAFAPPSTTANPTFINDVVIAGGSAWFTDSQKPLLYRVPLDLGAFQAVPLSGDLKHVAGAFNVNGIVATKDGQTLVLVQTATGELFTSDHNGVTKHIDLGGPNLVANGDGLLLEGRTLFVVQNQLNQIARIKLDRHLTSGTVVDLIKSDDFNVPTTIDRFGDRLYAVNARFGNPAPAEADYWITAVEAGRGKHRHHHHDHD